MWTQPTGNEWSQTDDRPAAQWSDAPRLPVRTVQDRLRERYDLAELSRERSVRGQFVRDAWRQGVAPDPDTAEVLLIGLLALDGEEELEVG